MAHHIYIVRDSQAAVSTGAPDADSARPAVQSWRGKGRPNLNKTSGGAGGNCVVRYRCGAALVEVVVGSMVLAMAAAIVGNVLLSSFVVKNYDRVRFTLAGETVALKEALKNYVTADTHVTLNAPGVPPWHMPEDSSCSGCWALAPGTHDVTQRLPVELRSKYAATLKYTVAGRSYKGRGVSYVKVEANWNIPTH